MITPASPTGRIVVFGATGYTGDLAARALVASGARPVLAGRDAARVARLAAELGGRQGPLEQAVANVTDPASVADLAGRGDVLVTTVGPFTRRGWPALEAAVSAGAHYVDSTGEGGFIRSVFEEYGGRAEASGSVLLTAFGYDYVPGNLAAALALDRARADGGEPVAVDVGYFLTGWVGAGVASGGTKASALGLLGQPGYALVGGVLVDERPGSRVLWTTAGGSRRAAHSISASEQFSLPRLARSLRTVRVGFGWLGAATPLVALASRATGAFDAALDLVPGARAGAARLAAPLVAPLVRGSSGGPDAARRARTGSLVAADVRDAAGRLLAHVELAGPNPYTLTGDLLAWAARALADGTALRAGAVGPVEAFGLAPLNAAAAAMGLVERAHHPS
ncbi:MAG: saccharopine dehydrogenase family protein [Kineosporiaceae bacterium]